MKKKLLGLTVILLATIACGSTSPATQASQPDINVIVAETFQALTANAPAATAAPQDNGQLTPDGTPVETAEVSFLIPNGVANNATSSMNTNVEYPYINPSNGDMPQHAAITLNLYSVTGTVYTPQIMIFRAEEYSQYSELTASTITTLQSFQYTDGQPLPAELDTNFTAQTHTVNFQNGHGVRYLTQVFQSFLPVNNSDLFYYYQGMTNDGKYFVQATLPINAAFLPADSSPNAPVPADGIPFNPDDFQGYLNNVAAKLNATQTYDFNPYLDALDEMIASMQVTGF